MVWLGDSEHRMAGSLIELWDQLVAAYPHTDWQNSPATGTKGDPSHQAQGNASDHNPWFQNTVRALDIATMPGGPDCEALFVMVNRLYGARDGRVYPDGYAIFRGRITDWDRPGNFKAQIGDPHNGHLHISVSTVLFNVRAPWPIGHAPAQPKDETMWRVVSYLDGPNKGKEVALGPAGQVVHAPTNTMLSSLSAAGLWDGNKHPILAVQVDTVAALTAH